MFLSDTRVCKIFLKMDVRCLLFKLLLFQMLVTWCGAKHVTIHLKSPQDLQDLEKEVQGSIRDLLHSGIYSHQHLDESQVQVIHPVKVTRDGELVSRAVDHSHEHGHARARRDLHGVEHEMPHSLHYNLTVDGRELRLDLRPSVTFITPALVVERHRASGRTRDRPRPEATACHYTGSVRGQAGSAVAISACDGLAGHLRTEQGEYWIEPSNQLPTDGREERPHIIFRRSAVDKVEAFHRKKRALENRDVQNENVHNKQQNNQRQLKQTKNQNDQNSKRNIDRRRSRLDADRRRREFLERRKKRLEAMRRNPIKYRKQQATLRMEERRHSTSKSNSVEASKSLEQSLEGKKRRNRNRNNFNNNDDRLTRIRNRRRRKRSKRRNCATKQPPYQWRTKNLQEQQTLRNNQNQQNAHYKRLNQRSQWDGARRSTRSVSKPRHVEVLLVADKSMTDFHNQGNLETYLLTIMNMVSSLYMDPSIGNYIKVVVVKIILVEEIEAARDLEVSTNADTTLMSFCKWQQNLNPEDDANPHHHDVAILVTRQDICSQHNSPCSTLGVAHVAGMCKPDRSCSVNEDNGIMLAHTITHELGHNFGLYHDTEKIGCHRREGATLHIMTPIFEADTVQVAWSRCSKRDVTNFLDAGLGECLSDRPSQEEYAYPEVPAGVMYDAASQCHLQFGAEAVVCAKPSELCEHLWCLVDDKCKTMLRPAAPGTTCGDNMWCQNQTCVPRQASPAPIDGGWSEWSEWSECSRTCGAGVSTQSRECNNPAPNNNGAYCIGDRSRYKVCNIDPCPINTPSFREIQCSKHNNKSYSNETVSEWIPYFDQDKPCDLLCMGKDTDLEMAGGFVSDGTPCKQTLGSRDMCIAGVCYQVGCDWVVGSNIKEDACGVCGGDGSACKTVLGSYSKDTTKQSGLDEVAVIPAGSRNVKIQEKVSPGNYISIGSARSRKMYLTGARNTTFTEYFVAGTQAIYERDRDWEKVRIPGPIAEDIKVYQRLYHGSKHRNPGVTYQYTVDAARLRPYNYRLSEWSPCSVTCGLGYISRQLECVDQHKRVVEQSQCYSSEPPPPEALRQRCHKPACPARPTHPARAAPHAAAYTAFAHPATHAASHPAPRTHWWTGTWKPCSKPCHMPGEEVTKQRGVYCVIGNEVIDDSRCELALKPITSIKCSEVPAC